MRIGILVHGLFLQAKERKNIVLGTPDKPGSLPRSIELMLRFGLPSIGHLVFGTGASEEGGLKEAEHTRLEFLEYFWQTVPDRALTRYQMHQVDQLLRSATLELAAKNTLEEIVAAAGHFAKHSCDMIVYVPTCASHGARCYKTYQQARAFGNIPQNQMWLAADPMTTFAGSTINDVVIIEPPHRTDDPMLDAPVKAHEVAGRLFKIAPAERKQFLVDTDQVLREKYKV
jgi:hypothetical protein